MEDVHTVYIYIVHKTDQVAIVGQVYPISQIPIQVRPSRQLVRACIDRVEINQEGPFWSCKAGRQRIFTATRKLGGGGGDPTTFKAKTSQGWLNTAAGDATDAWHV